MLIPNIIKKIVNGEEYERDTIGMSGSGIYLYENMVLKIQPVSQESSNELQMMQWLNGKIPVPNIIEHIDDNGYSYILMTKCSGKMACDDEFMSDPRSQAYHLTEALHRLWSVNISDCPCKWPLERRLEMAEDNVIHNQVDMDHVQPDTYGPNGFTSPEHLLRWLKENKPAEAPILTHGDFCLPNIMLTKNGLSGFIDLGKAGTADKWQDIALCCRSLSNNHHGFYNGSKTEGFEPQMLFDALGL